MLNASLYICITSVGKSVITRLIPLYFKVCIKSDTMDPRVYSDPSSRNDKFVELLQMPQTAPRSEEDLQTGHTCSLATTNVERHLLQNRPDSFLQQTQVSGNIHS